MTTSKSKATAAVDLGDDPDGDMDGYDGAVTEDAPATVPAEMSKEDRDKALREVYSEATKELRETHRKEFDQLRVKLAAARGIEWAPPQSPAEKAEQQIREMIEQHPELAERLGIKAQESDDA